MTHTEESPLQLRRLHDTATEEYRFTEQLLTAAFPPEEYRDFEELRALTQSDPRFRNHAILDRGEPVGVLSYWDFGRFHYVEHLRSRLHTPVVLEVERPDSELAARRIAFYRRNGFTLWESDYVQPPYRPGGDAVPMRLMVCGALCEADDFASVKETIHREVYGCPPATRG